MARLTSLVAILGALVLVTGCKDKRDKVEDPKTTPEAEDTSFAEDGTDSSAADTDTQLVTSSLVTSAPGEIALSTDLAAYVRPKCVTPDPLTGGPEVSYTFDNCQGRNGLRDVSGVIVARATKEPGKLHLELTFTDLEVNGSEIDGSASTDIVANGAERSLTWQATLSGTTAGGKSFSRESKHTVSWKLGEACFALDGTSTGKVRDREINTEIQGFRRCGRGCPDAGGRIIVTNVAKGKQTSLEYDGTNRATFTAPNGNVTVVPLLCRP